MDSIFSLSKSVIILILFEFNNPSPSCLIKFLVGILRDNFFFLLKYHENDYIISNLLLFNFLIYLINI